MPQLDLGQVVGPVGPQGPEGPAGPQGIQGPAGAPATINNVTTLTLAVGDNVNLEQSGSTATLSVPTGAPGGVAGLGENGAVPVAQGGTGAATPQAALANLGAGVRPNLLVNPYFVGGGSPGYLPVDQNADGVPDCWKKVDSRTTLDDAGNGLKIGNSALSGGTICFQQQTEPFRWDAPITVSFLVGDMSGSWYFSGSSIPNTLISSPGVTSVTVEPSAENWGGLLYLFKNSANPSDFITLQAVKVEYGRTQTLGYQDSAGAWQLLPQSDNDYQTQLAKCKYFFNRYNYVQSTLMGLGFALSAMELGLVFQIPVMRTNPTISVSSLSDLKISQGALASGVSPTGISSSYMDGEGNVNIALTVSGGLTPGAVYRVGLTGGYIDFSAEL